MNLEVINKSLEKQSKFIHNNQQEAITMCSFSKDAWREKILMEMARKSISNKDLAEVCHVSETTIGKILNGINHKIDVEMYKAINERVFGKIEKSFTCEDFIKLVSKLNHLTTNFKEESLERFFDDGIYGYTDKQSFLSFAQMIDAINADIKNKVPLFN